MDSRYHSQGEQRTFLLEILTFSICITPSLPPQPNLFLEPLTQLSRHLLLHAVIERKCNTVSSSDIYRLLLIDRKKLRNTQRQELW